MSEITNADIYNTLINMRGDLGRLEGKVDGHGAALTAHAASDEKIQTAAAEAISRLQLSQAKQRGFIAAVATIGGVIGAGIAPVIDWLRH